MAKITAANQRLVKGPDAGKGPEGDKQWFITGDEIFIPELAPIKTVKTKTATAIRKKNNKDKNELTLDIEGRELPIQAGRIILSMDDLSSAWTATIKWDPGADKQLDKITSPYSYSKSSVYIGGDLLVNGLLYDVEQGLSGSGRKKDLGGFSYTIDLVDSTMYPPYEESNVTLEDRIKKLAQPYGIEIDLDPEVNIGGAFKRVTAKNTDKIFKHINELAQQRSVLLSPTPEGNIFLAQAKVKGKPVGTIEEGQPGTSNFQGKFNGRKRYNLWKALGQSPRKTAKKVGLAKDSNVPGSRNITFTTNESEVGEIQKAAEWKRSKQLVDAFQTGFVYDGWYAPNGERWAPNTIVTVKSLTMGVPDGYNFLIRQVEFVFENNGRTTVLTLVPPNVYTGEPIPEPWIIK
jgi:prophage tail gpP-like protein